MTTQEVPPEGRAIVFTKEDIPNYFIVCTESDTMTHKCSMVHSSNIIPIICYIDISKNETACVPMNPQQLSDSSTSQSKE